MIDGYAIAFFIGMAAGMITAALAIIIWSHIA